MGIKNINTNAEFRCDKHYRLRTLSAFSSSFAGHRTALRAAPLVIVQIAVVEIRGSFRKVTMPRFIPAAIRSIAQPSGTNFSTGNALTASPGVSGHVSKWRIVAVQVKRCRTFCAHNKLVRLVIEFALTTNNAILILFRVPIFLPLRSRFLLVFFVVIFIFIDINVTSHLFRCTRSRTRLARHAEPFSNRKFLQRRAKAVHMVDVIAIIANESQFVILFLTTNTAFSVFNGSIPSNARSQHRH